MDRESSLAAAPAVALPAPKKKRSLPGTPDPGAEVIALSPRTLLATNRFVCEVCSKGFQRDQNLQLHRRGHNLPWKLRRRNGNDAAAAGRKRVYVCPEPGCVHHDPSRALGDLTGIKKHFCRKHGEKKWKCDRCNKLYAVQADWKAHAKTCGSREYRCDCGTIFSRKDSFITHRAFCDALAEESFRARAAEEEAAGDEAAPATEPPKHQEIDKPIELADHAATATPATAPSNNTSISSGGGGAGVLAGLCTSMPLPACMPGDDPPLLFSQQFALSMSSSANISATALLQKATQMGSLPSSSTEGFGLDGTEAVVHPWGWRTEASAGLCLGLSHENGAMAMLPELMMGDYAMSGGKPATLDFLGLGMGISTDAAGNEGFSAMLPEISGAFDMPRATVEAFGSSAVPEMAAWYPSAAAEGQQVDPAML